MTGTYVELLAKDIAEIRGEEANHADYLPKDPFDAVHGPESEFVPWDGSTSDDE